MAFYSAMELRDGALIGHRNGEEYRIMDDSAVLEFFKENCEKPVSEFVKNFLSNKNFFGTDLTELGNTEELVTGYLTDIKNLGMREAILKHFG